MKKFFVVSVVAVALFTTFVGCNYINDQSLGLAPTGKEKQERKERAPQLMADFVATNMIFFEEPRTGLCFAYVPDGRGLALVPKENIPPELLRVAKIK